MRILVPSAALLALLQAAAAPAQTPLGTGFTYQGRLQDGGGPASGAYDLRFILYDAAAGGSPIGPTVTRDDLAVADGLFTVSLDFAAAFAGSQRWLEVAVRPGASTGTFTTLAPRQELTPSPGALFSAAAPWAGVSGKPAGFADGVDDDSGGTVTSVTAGTGLTGGTITTTGTLGVAFAGSGGSATAARSDHDHLGQTWTGTDNGLAVVTSGIRGIHGESSHTFGISVQGWSTSPSGSTFGVRGQSDSPAGRGVFGYASAATGVTLGVWGQSASSQGRGLQGTATAASGVNYGVLGESSSPEGVGVAGLALASTGDPIGVRGQSSAPFGQGVAGFVTATTGSPVAVYGENRGGGIAVAGLSLAGSGAATGVYGDTVSPIGIGVHGRSLATTGSGHGVLGQSSSVAGLGVFGYGGRYGVAGQAWGEVGTNFAVYGAQSPSPLGYAGYFDGRLHVNGVLSKSAGSFKIDHPLDPANKYLYHSFVESPDMKNVYDGVTTTDGQGFATVELPEWFEALNRDFRYQLTVMGDGAWARARVFRKIAGHRFVVQTDLPAVEVSWQVTGIRQDPFAETNRIPVEEPKPDDERGSYLHPEAWGRPPEEGLRARRQEDGPTPATLRLPEGRRGTRP